MPIFQFLLNLVFKVTRLIRPIFNLLPPQVRNYLSGFVRNRATKSLKNIRSDKIRSWDEAYGKPGINLVGYPNSSSGLGQLLKFSARALSESFDVVALDVSFSSFQKQMDASNLKVVEESVYNINLFCQNGDGLITTLAGANKNIWKKKYNIQYAAWELENYPKPWIVLDDFVHEYWAISEYTANSIQKVSSLPCVNMGIPVGLQFKKNKTRQQFGLPDNKFLFFTIFDINSVMERKNPKAVIESFLRSFTGDEKVGLVLKVSRTKGRAEQDLAFKELLRMTEDSNKIYLVDEILDRESMLNLINLCDSFVSLHRSEGFGLGIAEAMGMGKLAIATGYSGNLDFMNKENSLLVNFELIPLEAGEYPYGENAVWAEPSKISAIECMRKAYFEREYCEKLAIQGKMYIEEHFSFEAFSKKYKNQIEKIFS